VESLVAGDELRLLGTRGGVDHAVERIACEAQLRGVESEVSSDRKRHDAAGLQRLPHPCAPRPGERDLPPFDEVDELEDADRGDGDAVGSVNGSDRVA
jgi:hypothetical protein